MRSSKKHSRQSSSGFDIDLAVMVLFLLVMLIFDKPTTPGSEVVLDQSNTVSVVDLADSGEVINPVEIEGEEITEPNYASSKEDEVEYIYSIGDIVDIEMDGEIIHFVVLDIIEGEAVLREIGIPDGKGLTIKNIKHMD